MFLNQWWIQDPGSGGANFLTSLIILYIYLCVYVCVRERPSFRVVIFLLIPSLKSAQLSSIKKNINSTNHFNTNQRLSKTHVFFKEVKLMLLLKKK